MSTRPVKVGSIGSIRTIDASPELITVPTLNTFMIISGVNRMAARSQRERTAAASEVNVKTAKNKAVELLPSALIRKNAGEQEDHNSRQPRAGLGDVDAEEQQHRHHGCRHVLVPKRTAPVAGELRLLGVGRQMDREVSASTMPR